MEGQDRSSAAPAGVGAAGASARQDAADRPPAELMRLLAKALSREFGSALSERLGMPVEVRPSGLEPCSWAEFLGSVEEPSCCLGVGRAAPGGPEAEGTQPDGSPTGQWVWMEISPQIAFPVMDRLLGGSGRDWCVPSRPLTEIEQPLLRRVAAMAAEGLGRCWPAGQGSSPPVRWECGPAVGEASLPPGGAVLLARFTLTMGRHAGALRLCVPRQLLPAAAALDAGRCEADRREGAPGSFADPRSRGGPLELSVVVQDISVSHEELARLEAGDVLLTDTPADGELLVRVGGIPKYYARLGTSGGRRAIRITRRVDQPPPTA